MARWVVERSLGVGATADVLLARARSREGDRVALKVLRPELANDPEANEAFRREGALAATLVHEHIARVAGVDEHEGRPCIVLEPLDGLDLRAVFAALARARARMHPAQAFVVAAAVARGLEHAHAAGVVHRDVSPENVFLTESGDVKLLDFGIAKVRAIATRSGLVRGKPAYMAPEQVVGLEVDARTDVFALGVVVWEMLTGRRREEPARAPSTFDADLGADVDVLVASMLAELPQGRPREVAEALSELARRHGSRSARREVAAVVRRCAQ